MRMIDADALIESIKRQCNFCRLMPDEEVKQLADIMEKGLVEEINNAPTIEPIEWIPCSERLPSNFGEDETVLATTDVDGDKVIAMFALDVKSFYLKGYVSAWMPLPAPWKGADDDMH